MAEDHQTETQPTQPPQPTPPDHPPYILFNVLHRTDRGVVFVNRNDGVQYGGVRNSGKHEHGDIADVMVAISRTLPKGSLYLDVGANFGFMTTILATHLRLTDPSARLISFEPMPLTYYVLNANLALYSLDNVITKQLAIGNRQGFLTLPSVQPAKPQDFGMISLRHDKNEEQAKRLPYHHQVPIMPLDELIEGPVGLMKIDVEGMDLQVLEGAKNLIATYKPYLIVEYWMNKNGLRQILQDYGYRLIDLKNGRDWLATPPEKADEALAALHKKSITYLPNIGGNVFEYQASESK